MLWEQWDLGEVLSDIWPNKKEGNVRPMLCTCYHVTAHVTNVRAEYSVYHTVTKPTIVCHTWGPGIFPRGMFHNYSLPRKWAVFFYQQKLTLRYVIKNPWQRGTPCRDCRNTESPTVYSQCWLVTTALCAIYILHKKLVEVGQRVLIRFDQSLSGMSGSKSIHGYA